MRVPKKTTDTSKLPRLPEMQPLLVEIERSGPEDKRNPEYIDGEYKGQPRKQVRVRMRVIDGPFAGDPNDPENAPPGKVWGTHGFTLEKRKNGESSLLRQLVVAATGITDEAELHDFDLDDLPGRRLIVLGRYPEDDEERIYLKPIAYSSPSPAQNRVTAPAAAAPAAAEDGYQYSPDRTLRWKEGMAGWEPVPAPAAATPPPLPAAPALPPPLPAGAATTAAPAAPGTASSRADF